MCDLTRQTYDDLIEMRANVRQAIRQLEGIRWGRTVAQDEELTRLRALQRQLAREIGNRVHQLPLF